MPTTNLDRNNTHQLNNTTQTKTEIQITLGESIFLKGDSLHGILASWMKEQLFLHPEIMSGKEVGHVSIYVNQASDEVLFEIKPYSPKPGE